MEVELVRKRKKKNKYKVFTFILILILISGSVGVFVVYNESKVKLSPDYAPGKIDVNAIKEKDDGTKMEKTEGGAVSISYSNVVKVDGDKMQLYFKNPSKSLEDVVIQIIVIKDNQEYVIGQTDLLPTGYAIYETSVKENVKLDKGGYDGKFRLYYYDEGTKEKAIVNTDIDVKIEVI